MASNTGIEWCDATVNPVMGCTRVSPGCEHCYAARMMGRLAANPATPQYAGGYVDAAGAWTGRMGLHLAALAPLAKWRKPRRVFVGSMADLFHPARPWPDICAVLDELYAFGGRHTYLFLTKHPYIMAGAFRMWLEWHGLARLPLNWQVGVTVEDQARADVRIPLLLGIPAAVRFVSCEPLLGPVGFDRYGWFGGCVHCCNKDRCYSDDEEGCTHHYRPHCPHCHGTGNGPHINWVIAGCESGPQRRPSDPKWFYGLIDQCQFAGVPLFIKQMEQEGQLVKAPFLRGRQWQEMPEVTNG